MKTRDALVIDMLRRPDDFTGQTTEPAIEGLNDDERACLIALLEDQDVPNALGLESLVCKGLVTLSIS